MKSIIAVCVASFVVYVAATAIGISSFTSCYMVAIMAMIGSNYLFVQNKNGENAPVIATRAAIAAAFTFVAIVFLPTTITRDAFVVVLGALVIACIAAFFVVTSAFAQKEDRNMSTLVSAVFYAAMVVVAVVMHLYR